MDILNKLILKDQFRGYLFYDFTKRRRQGFPKGYYIGLKTKFNDNGWKIDLWFLNKVRQAAFLPTLRQIGDNKATILKLKYQVLEKNLKIPSIDIYKAVIQRGIKDINKIKKYHI
jgi:uncharacterized membrane protein